jgi:hypothetical protein
MIEHEGARFNGLRPSPTSLPTMGNVERMYEWTAGMNAGVHPAEHGTPELYLPNRFPGQQTLARLTQDNEHLIMTQPFDIKDIQEWEKRYGVVTGPVHMKFTRSVSGVFDPMYFTKGRGLEYSDRSAVEIAKGYGARVARGVYWLAAFGTQGDEDFRLPMQLGRPVNLHLDYAERLHAEGVLQELIDDGAEIYIETDATFEQFKELQNHGRTVGEAVANKYRMMDPKGVKGFVLACDHLGVTDAEAYRELLGEDESLVKYLAEIHLSGPNHRPIHTGDRKTTEVLKVIKGAVIDQSPEKGRTLAVQLDYDPRKINKMSDTQKFFEEQNRWIRSA